MDTNTFDRFKKNFHELRAVLKDIRDIRDLESIEMAIQIEIEHSRLKLKGLTDAEIRQRAADELAAACLGFDAYNDKSADYLADAEPAGSA